MEVKEKVGIFNYQSGTIQGTVRDNSGNSRGILIHILGMDPVLNPVASCFGFAPISGALAYMLQRESGPYIYFQDSSHAKPPIGSRGANCPECLTF